MTTTFSDDELYALRESSDGKAPDRMPGWATRAGIRSLYSAIAPGLWMGGTRDGDTVDTPVAWDYKPMIGEGDFTAVVTCYPAARPVDWGVDELRVSLLDTEQLPLNPSQIIGAARWAYGHWKADGEVLVRCQAGLNRSGLVTACVLVMDGWTAVQAIKHLRRMRSHHVLFNKSFVKWLVAHEKEIRG